MPLVPMFADLKKAQAGHYAVPCFDTVEMLATEGMFAALEEKRAPAFVAVTPTAFDTPNAEAFCALLRVMAQKASTPVSLLLDHGRSYEQCVRALAWGFTDVMFDGSRLPVEENMAITRYVVRAAHAVGARAEAELGHVGRGADYADTGSLRQGFTQPDQVERFVAETGVDSLAVAIGSAHGVYAAEPHLDLDLLAEIRRRVETPLVMHGGSGLSDDQFRGAIAAGMSKINIFTDLAQTTGRRMVEEAQDPKATYFTLQSAMRKAFYERCGFYIDLFGATGKA